MWNKTVSLYRGPLIKVAIKMLMFVASAPNSHYLYSPLVTLFVPLVLYLLNGTIFPMSMMLIPVLLQVYIWVYLSIPPSVIYLSQSCPESICFRDQLERQVNPYRVLACFSPSIARKTHLSSFQQNLFDWDNLWTTSNADWKAKVFSLIEIVPAIVVDTRYPSYATEEEIAYILETGHLRKTLFVAEKHNLPQVANALSGVGDVVWNVSTPEELSQRLSELGIVNVSPPPTFRILS
jgi:hypothetical protein